MAGFLELTGNTAWMQTVRLLSCRVTNTRLLSVSSGQKGRVGEAKQLWERKTSHMKNEMNLDCRCTQG